MHMFVKGLLMSGVGGAEGIPGMGCYVGRN